jgi:hypothetical protein
MLARIDARRGPRDTRTEVILDLLDFALQAKAAAPDISVDTIVAVLNIVTSQRAQHSA